MKIISKRELLIGLAALAQIVLIILLLTILDPVAELIEFILVLIGFVLVLNIVSKYEESTYKILWLILLLMFPLAGTLIYLIVGGKKSGRKLQDKITKASAKMKQVRAGEISDACQKLANERPRLAASINKVETESGFRACEIDTVKYYPIGEAMYADMLPELEKAERYIYCEYFIIGHGKMWDQMEEIMARKAQEGVVVRVMYDDLGSLGTFAPSERKRLEERGIQCIRFNSIKMITGTVNYRNHRKMLIIDGKTAFSGGVNIADEYINEIERFGHWKDIGFKVTGETVKNYVYMFASFWNAFAENKIKPSEAVKGIRFENEEHEYRGTVLSYYDSPLVKEDINNDLYIDLIYQATDYIWFYTPYLLPGSSLLEAITNAARRGVDVRIITPGIPDKKMVFRMTRSYYEQLISEGVRVYEYTPGFLHGKAVLMDDYLAAVGTVNLDYRSLFLHFENNSVFIDSDITKDLKKDFYDTMEKSTEQTIEGNKKGFFGRILNGILRIITPLC